MRGLNALRGCVVVVFLGGIAMAVYMQMEMARVQQETAEEAQERLRESRERMTEMIERSTPAQQPSPPSNRDDVEGGDQYTPGPGEASAEPAERMTHPLGYRLIPPVSRGTMAEMWSGLKEPGVDLYLVTFNLEDLRNRLSKEGAGNAAGLRAENLYVQQTLPDGTRYRFLAVYTDAGFFNGKPVALQAMSPKNALAFALFDEKTDGVYFNPKSRILDVTKYAVGINTFGIAEVLGYLEAPEDPPDRPYHELANRAAEAERHYLVQYYWAMSRREPRPGDDWKRAELAKLRSWWALDFPGARERALGELEWFIREHNPGPEAKRLLATWEDEQ